MTACTAVGSSRGGESEVFLGGRGGTESILEVLYCSHRQHLLAVYSMYPVCSMLRASVDSCSECNDTRSCDLRHSSDLVTAAQLTGGGLQVSN